jgi:hypothetical protein
MSKSEVERIATEGGEREAKSKANTDRELTNAELDGVTGGVSIEPAPAPIGPIDPGSFPIDPNGQK